MFKKKGGCYAINTDGFEVIRCGRDEWTYSEKRPNKEIRKVTFFAGMCIGGRIDFVLEVGARWLNHWDPPHEMEQISEGERQRIVKNITDAMDFLKIEYEVKQ